MLVVCYVYLHKECCILEVVYTCAQKCSVLRLQISCHFLLSCLTMQVIKALSSQRWFFFPHNCFILIYLVCPGLHLFCFTFRCSSGVISHSCSERQTTILTLRLSAVPFGFMLILKIYLQIAYRECFPDCEY